MIDGTASAAVAGRYALLDQVGSGGMGAVWRARDLRAGPGQEEVVAVKVLGAHDGAMLLRFVREQALRIHHPHVLTPLGWAAEDHQVVLATTLVRGGSVDDLVAEHGALPAAYVATLLDQLLQALAAVHAAGVVHRDVKPANLLLEPGSPYLRLGDFGVAVAVGDVRLTRDQGVVGTDGYLAPEALAGGPPDPRHDLYAVGVVAAELLTGRSPRPGIRPLVPDGPLRTWAESLTEPDRALRPPSAAVALERLRQITVPADGPWPVVPDRLGDPPDARRPRWPTALGAASVLVILGCLLALAVMVTG